MLMRTGKETSTLLELTTSFKDSVRGTNTAWYQYCVVPILRGTNTAWYQYFEVPILRGTNTSWYQYFTWKLKSYVTAWWRIQYSENLTVAQFPALYGVRMLITVFIISRLLYLSWTSSVQSTPSHPVYFRICFNVVLSLGLGHAFDIFLLGSAWARGLVKYLVTS